MSETIEAIRVMGLGRFLYARFIYRHHMRFIHKRGGHGRHIRPIDRNIYCSWCGHLTTPDGAVIVDGPAMMERVRLCVEESKRTGKLASTPSPSAKHQGGGE